MLTGGAVLGPFCLSLRCFYASLLAIWSTSRNVIPANGDTEMTGVQGLEAEYDRLLAENDGLKRRLSRTDPTFEASHRASDKKST